MIKHYLKLIIKSFRKSGKVTVFNLIGLSVSFAAFILLSIFLYNEFTFDQHNEKYKSIFRLNMEVKSEGNHRISPFLPNPMADVILENVSEIQSLCSFSHGAFNYVKDTDPTNFLEIDTRAVDSTFTEIFTIRIKSGTDHPLKEKDRIIISEETAKRIYGDEDPVGKTLLANYKTPYIIDAVFYNLPVNSSFKPEAFCSFPTDEWVNDWSEYSFNHYFLITPNADFQEINRKICEIPQIDEIIKNYPDAEINYSFTPLADYHFDENGGKANLTFAKTLILVAFLVLFMAFINYINFAIANAPKLIRSINMRRIVGESKRRLILILNLENAFLVTLSFGLSILICNLTLQLWPDLFGYEIVLSNYIPQLSLSLLIFYALGIIFSIYPSHIMVNVKPALALKGLFTFSAKQSASGKTLTVIQYSISILLILGVLFIEKQVSYLKNYDLGFKKENILVVNTTHEITKQEKAFAEELMNNPNITDYAYSQFVPGGVGMSWGRTIEEKRVSFYAWPVDERYLKFMGFEIVEGVNFSSNIEADENCFIFNQKALEEFGWTENYLGKLIPGFNFEGKLIGIVKDIKYASLHEEVMPMAFWLTKTRHNRISLKINGKDIHSTLEHVKKTYAQFEKKYSIKYSFLDDDLDKLYKREEKQAQLIFIFCMISIIISIVGALGLIIFMCEYRVKEIGVRKINGATVTEIVTMLNVSFVKWILLAFLIAAPISYYLLNTWLQNFAYRTELSWWIFVLAGLIALSISLLTVSWISWRAARRNPVEALRYE